MEDTTRFVILARSGHFTLTELREQLWISRKTGCKHLKRNTAQGKKALGAELSAALVCQPER